MVTVDGRQLEASQSRIAVAIRAPTFLSASFHTLFVLDFDLVLVLRFPKTLKGRPVKLADVVFAAILMNMLSSRASAGATCESVAMRIRDGKTERTRPLCPYPQVATYRGTGSTDDGANFSCSAPK
jgi:hypothetical protein